MESDARYVWVGVAVLALLVLLAGGVYWLQGGEGHAVRRFLVYFQNQSLEGLQLNSDVRMQGIKVGKVLDYSILPGQAKTVRVVLEVDARTPILEGVEAVVSRNLVTSLAAVDLNNVWKGGEPLTQIPEGEEHIVIEEGVPQMERFTRNLEDLGLASQEALGRFNKLLSDDNQHALAATLHNVADLSGEARQVLPRLVGTLDATRAAAQRLDAVGSELVPVVRESGQLVRRAEQHLDGLARETELTLQTTRASLQSLDAGLRDVQLQLRLSADLGMQEIQSTALAMRLAAESLQTTSRDFADPGRLLFGPNPGELGPGETK